MTKKLFLNRLTNLLGLKLLELLNDQPNNIIKTLD